MVCSKNALNRHSSALRSGTQTQTQQRSLTEASREALLQLLGGLLCQSSQVASRLASSSKATLLGVGVSDGGGVRTGVCPGLALTSPSDK